MTLEPEPGHDRKLPELPRHRHSIEFEGVTFTDPGGAAPALRDVRLTVRFGDSGCITWRIAPWEGTFDYDPAADTLVDHEGITWHRGQ